MDKQTERETIERAAAGDEAAATALIRAHQASLYAFMLRMSGKPEIAEDIVQDAFVRVLANLDRFDPRFRFSTWLFTIAKRLYMNAAAKLRPVFDTEMVSSKAGDSARPIASWSPDDADDQRTERAVLADALAELNADQREIVVLFHQMDWPIARIAEHKGMPEGTVKSHLHRGRKRLRELIETKDTPASVSVCQTFSGSLDRSMTFAADGCPS